MAVDISTLFELKGKTAVITGASGTICGTMAENLALYGVNVVILDIKAETIDETITAVSERGGSVRAYKCDVLDEAGLKEVCRAIGETWGGPDFLINGAGGNHPSASTSLKFLDSEQADHGSSTGLFDLELDNFKGVLDLNFLGTFLPIKIFGKEMARRGEGVIVNISSMSGLVPLTKVPAYSAAKAAVINLTKWLAVHLAPSGIRVNTIAPGFISTEQSRFLQFDRETGELNERGREIIENTPMKRFGEAEELLGTLVWLLSEASQFVTGIVVPVDGGFSSYSI